MSEVYAIVYTERNPAAKEAAERVKRILENRGLAAEIYSASNLIYSSLPESVSLVITLGGDGTILKTVGALGNPEAAILGVNFGRGGYLTEVEAEDLDKALERVLVKDYTVERKMMLSITVDGESVGDALNEAYIASQILGKTLSFVVRRDDEVIAEGSADGLIIASPIGSTAYSFSAGGPIVDDDLEAVILTPVCPISGLKPMVLSLNHRIDVLAGSDYGFSMVIDGYRMRKFYKRSLMINVRRSSRSVAFLRLGPGGGLARRIRKKLA
ncbi:MAG: NAD(+)/NADH kinase [Thaumarchaeota archaeon]|jgi:NAD+ kinase|nr:NAD(+)/NADH kinase [Nitrososphaerota archaeon]